MAILEPKSVAKIQVVLIPGKVGRVAQAWRERDEEGWRERDDEGWRERDEGWRERDEEG